MQHWLIENRYEYKCGGDTNPQYSLWFIHFLRGFQLVVPNSVGLLVSVIEAFELLLDKDKRVRRVTYVK